MDDLAADVEAAREAFTGLGHRDRRRFVASCPGDRSAERSQAGGVESPAFH
jgi:hypothetical protein